MRPKILLLICALASTAASRTKIHMKATHTNSKAWALLELDAATNELHLSASKCVHRHNWCGRYQRLDCPASLTRVVNRITFRSTDGMSRGRVALHADGTLAFHHATGTGACVSITSLANAETPKAPKLRFNAAGAADARATIALHKEGFRIGAVVVVDGASAEPQCTCENGAPSTEDCPGHERHHCASCSLDEHYIAPDGKCTPCDSLPVCPHPSFQVRRGCAGTSPGRCVADCGSVGGPNCYIGEEGGTWFASTESWSQGAFPRFATHAVVEKKVQLTREARGAADTVVIGGERGTLEIKGGSATLQIGPRQCRANEVQIVAATATSDAQCDVEVPCTSTQWEVTARTTTAQAKCKPIRACAFTQWQRAAPTRTSDRVCVFTTICSAGEYETTAPTATSDRVCATHSAQCVASHWQTKPPTPTSDRECAAIQSCSADHWETAPPTRTSDRACAALSTCAADEFESKAPGKLHDRKCAPTTVCAADQWESAAPTLTADRICTALSEPCGEGQYEWAAPGPTNDRGCLPLTACEDGEFASAAPTPTSDRECTAHTTCARTQHQTRDGSAVLDRTCRDNTVCGDGEYEAKAPTATTDRTCALVTSAPTTAPTLAPTAALTKAPPKH